MKVSSNLKKRYIINANLNEKELKIISLLSSIESKSTRSKLFNENIRTNEPNLDFENSENHDICDRNRCLNNGDNDFSKNIVNKDKDIEQFGENYSKNINFKIYNCELCGKQSNYTCPKCKIKYCSLNCYKKHSENCTETFYKNQIEIELKNKKNQKDDKIKSILKEHADKLDEINSPQNLLNLNGNNDNNNYNENEVEILEKKVEKFNKILECIENRELERIDNILNKEDWMSFMDYFQNKMDISSMFEVGTLFYEIKNEFDEIPTFYITEINDIKDINDESLNHNNDECRKKVSNKTKNVVLNDLIIINDSENSKEMNKIDKKEKNDKEDIDPLLINKKKRNKKNKMNRTNQISVKDYIAILKEKYSNIPDIENLYSKKPDLRLHKLIFSLVFSYIYCYKIYFFDIRNNISEIVNIINTINFDSNDFDVITKIEGQENINYHIMIRLGLYEKLSYDELTKLFKSIANISLNVLKNKFYLIDCMSRVYEIYRSFYSLLISKIETEVNYNDDNDICKSENNINQLKDLLLQIQKIKKKVLFLLSFVKSKYYDKNYDLYHFILHLDENKEVLMNNQIS